MSDHPVIDSLEASRPAQGGRRLSFGGSAVFDQVLRETNHASQGAASAAPAPAAGPPRPEHHAPLSSSATLSTSPPSSSSSSSFSTTAPMPIPSTAGPSTTINTTKPTTSTGSTGAGAGTTMAATSPRSGMGLSSPPHVGWQALQSKSSNHVPLAGQHQQHQQHQQQRGSSSTATKELAMKEGLEKEEQEGGGGGDEEKMGGGGGGKHEHDKPSVLPKILPGFQERLADVHHASLKSVTGSSRPLTTAAIIGNGSGGGAGKEIVEHVAATAGHGHHHLSKNSILYESADVPLLGELDVHNNGQRPLPSSSTSHQQHQQQQSSTLVQGGSGTRRWSHELSPEKAGLVGSVLEAAGLIKDVVLDKMTTHRDGDGDDVEGSAVGSGVQDADGLVRGNNNKHNNASQHHQQQQQQPLHELTEQDRQTAARAAFGGGSEEMGDQSVYYSGLKSNPTAPTGSTSPLTTATPTSPGYHAQDLLASAPQAGQAHRRSMLLHEAASNPEVYKGLLLHHPEKLGYHSRDPDWVGPVVSEDPVLARLGVSTAPNNSTVSPVSPGSSGMVMTNADDRREQQK